MKKHLISFGSQGYENGLQRLKKSAEGFFDTITLYGPGDIDATFYKQNEKILTQPRGAGYWLWKPYFILERLNQVEDGDLVFYTDALVEFKKPSEIDNIVDDSFAQKIMLFHQKYTNDTYTKRDCLRLMCDGHCRYIYGPHLNAAFMGFVKAPETLKFVREWLFWCRQPECLTDQPNEYGDNPPTFRDHRHDQSILSLLAIKHGILTQEDISQYGNSPYGVVINHHRTK